MKQAHVGGRKHKGAWLRLQAREAAPAPAPAPIASPVIQSKQGPPGLMQRSSRKSTSTTFCTICQHMCTSAEGLTLHNLGKTHAKNAAAFLAKHRHTGHHQAFDKLAWKCHVCDTFCTSQQQLQVSLSGLSPFFHHGTSQCSPIHARGLSGLVSLIGGLHRLQSSLMIIDGTRSSLFLSLQKDFALAMLHCPMQMALQGHVKGMKHATQLAQLASMEQAPSDPLATDAPSERLADASKEALMPKGSKPEISHDQEDIPFMSEHL